MRGGVLVSSVRLCEIYIALKYTQLAAMDKKDRRYPSEIIRKNHRQAACQAEGKTANLRLPATADIAVVLVAKNNRQSRVSRDNSALKG